MNPKTVSKRDEKRMYNILLAAVVFIIGFGTVFYHYVEGWPWVDSYYFCVVTLATIGYGDFVPQTDFAKIFTTVYIFIGIGILSAFVRVFLTGRGKQLLQHRKEHEKQEKKSDHNQT